jgi:abortive infection bacteriophage resistance protein
MHFNKLPTTIDDQITLLIERGMQGDQSLMRRWLETVGYYRLSAYWLPFEVPPTDGQTRSKQFANDLQFDTIVDIYVFDRKLRLLIMEAIERIEIALRARWTNRLALAHGSHAHLDASRQALEPAYRQAAAVDQTIQRRPGYRAGRDWQRHSKSACEPDLQCARGSDPYAAASEPGHYIPAAGS